MVNKSIRSLLWSGGILVFLLLFLSIRTSPSYAEGSKDLVENGGFRPYSEWAHLDSVDISRTQVIKVYAKKGETIYFGTSVNDDWAVDPVSPNSVRHPDGNVRIVKPDGKEFQFTGPLEKYNNTGENTRGINVGTGEDKTGYIKTPEQEQAGPDIKGTGTGYVPLSFQVDQTGIWEFEFHGTSWSQDQTNVNPAPVSADSQWPEGVTDRGKYSQGYYVAAWDISVVPKNAALPEDGRIFADCLMLNMGDYTKNYSGLALNSKVYVLTADGYVYETDFNGIDPYGFVFFANNRGLVSTKTSGSLMHSVKDAKTSGTNPVLSNIAELKDINGDPDGAFVPNPGTAKGQTSKSKNIFYSIFFNEPSETYIQDNSLNHKPPGQVSNIRFLSKNGDSNAAYVGEGGMFFYNADENVSNVEIRIKIAENNTVTLSDSCTPGENSIFWDGRDAFGEVVPAGTTLSSTDIQIIPLAGTYHFPLIDVENLAKGVKVTRLSQYQGESDADYDEERSVIYYNNRNDDSLRKGTISGANLNDYWNLSDENMLEGMNTSINGGPILTGDKGDKTLLDLWTKVNGTTVSYEEDIVIKDRSADTKGSMRGLVFYDSNKDGIYSETDGDYPLSGIKVTLTKSGESAAIQEVYTNNNGRYNFFNMENGTYDIEVADQPIMECTTTADDGISDNKVQQGLTLEADVLEVVATDVGFYYASQEMILYKQNTKGDALNGAEFKLYEDPACGIEVTGDGAPKITRGENGTHKITGLALDSTYYMKETKAPTGYVTDNRIYEVKIEAGGAITVKEKSALATDFEVCSSFDSQKSELTITDFQEKVDITVTKIWNDGDNQDGKRPQSIAVQLKQDDQAYGKPVTLQQNAEGKWTYSWTDLDNTKTDVNGNRTELQYTIEEINLPTGYEKNVAATEDNSQAAKKVSFSVTNSYTPETVSVSIAKKWEKDTVLNRPDVVQVQLYQKYKNEDGAPQKINDPITLSKDGWAYTIDDLPKYEKGKELAYSVQEITKLENYNVTYQSRGQDNRITLTVTNTYAPETTIHTVKKIWNDGSDADGERPKSIQVQLYQDDTPYLNSVTLQKNSQGEWAYTWTDLQKKDDSGHLYAYAAVETSIPDTYIKKEQTIGTQTTITNTHEFETVDKTVKKIWNDQGGAAGKRQPITVQLKKDGINYGDPVTFGEDKGWSHTWKNLPKNSGGAPIDYTVAEVTKLTRYETSYSALDGILCITNTYVGKAEVIFSKRSDTPKWISRSGGKVTYNILAENKGDATAKNVMIRDRIPEGMTFVHADHGGKLTQKYVVWNLGDIPAGKTAVVTVTVKADSWKEKGNRAFTNVAQGQVFDEEEPDWQQGTGWLDTNSVVHMQEGYQQVNPTNPSDPNDSNGPNNSVNPNYTNDPATGDSSNLWIPITICTAAAVVIIILLLRRKK